LLTLATVNKQAVFAVSFPIIFSFAEVFLNTFFDRVKQGDHYLQSWPKQRVLNSLFLDSKVVFYTRFAMKIAPLFVVLIVMQAFLFPMLLTGSATVTFILFLLSLPLQGLYWLGKRSTTFLPDQLLPWYTEIEKTLNNHQQESITTSRPCYLDLALLLKNGFKRGGDNFLQDNELI